ncbi:RagB/SusD family nutrient uptake outer membrane protein [Empedobacter sp. ULE_I140]
MKKIKYILPAILLGSTILVSSCNEDFTDTKPTSSVGDQQIYSTADNLMAAVSGMHRNMYVRWGDQGQVGYFGMLMRNDLLADDLIYPSVGNNWFVTDMRWEHQVNDNSTVAGYIWNYWYRVIRNANNIITYGKDATGDPKLKDQATGEAYAYRAFALFDLVQKFSSRYVGGQDNKQDGVIIRTDPNDMGQKARASVEEVYKQIWADLDAAETLLTGKTKANNSHFGVDNVQGLKARVALVQQDYKKAADFAKKARTGKVLMSQEDYKKGFNDYTNPEWMWGVRIASDQDDVFGNFGAYMTRNFNSGQIRSAPKVMSKKLYDLFPSTDVRRQLTDPTGYHLPWFSETNSAGKVVRKSPYTAYSAFAYTSEKFMTTNPANANTDVPFMRVSEMYLIEAEAKYMSGDEAGSKTVLTELVKARDKSFTSFTTTGVAYLDQVLLNRRMELWGEGFRFLDLKRRGEALDRTGSNFVTVVINSVFKVEANDKRWTYLIPRTEIEANPLCKQNPS